MSETRKLAAILVADVVGYSRLAGADEERTLARLRALRSDLIDPTIALYHGRMVKRTGDGSIIEFRSVVDPDYVGSYVNKSIYLNESRRHDEALRVADAGPGTSVCTRTTDRPLCVFFTGTCEGLYVFGKRKETAQPCASPQA
jgi:class 3 adenylate cyclase